MALDILGNLETILPFSSSNRANKFPVMDLDTSPALRRRLSSSDIGTVTAFATFFQPPSGVPAGAEEFVSDLPRALRGGILLSAPAGPSVWTVEQICGVLAVAVIVPFILASNLLVILSVVRFKRLQLPTNCFIVSLAAVDIFVALVTPFVIVVELLPGQVKDLFLCLAPNRILMSACGVSVLTLAAIAYDRHTALVSPLKYVTVMTIRKIGLLVTLTWVYSAVIVWAPLPLGWFSKRLDSFQSAGTPYPCSFKLLHDSAHVLFLSAIVVPACLAITVCYFRIYTVARHHAKAIAAVENSVHHNIRVKFMIKDAKYAKTLALVIGVFLVLWTPYLACLFAEVLTDVSVSPWVWNYLTLIAVLNSGLNPWIYAFKNNEFRAAFRKILKSYCGAGRNSSCLGFQKDPRRPSSFLDAFTTTTTAQSRVSRLSHEITSPSGRRPDLSHVISLAGDGDEFIRKAFGLRCTDLLGQQASDDRVSSVPLTLNCDALFCLKTSDSVSTVLDEGTKAFLMELLSLCLHQSFVTKQMITEFRDGRQSRDQSDLSDHSNSLDQSEHTEHSYQSEHTEHSYQSEHAGHSYQSEHTEHSYQSEHAKHRYQGEPTEHSYQSEHAKHNYQSEHKKHSHQREPTEHNYQSEQTEHTYQGELTEHSYQSEKTENNYQSEHTEHSYQSEHTEHSYQTEHTENNYQSEHTENNYQSEHMKHSYHSEHTTDCYSDDHRDHPDRHSVVNLSSGCSQNDDCRSPIDSKFSITHQYRTF